MEVSGDVLGTSYLKKPFLKVSGLTLLMPPFETHALDLWVIIKKGFHQATFLPQVWEQLPDKKEFLTHLCLKAGLETDSWKREKLEVSTYQVQAFEEH
jgi:hypothetical protein